MIIESSRYLYEFEQLKNLESMKTEKIKMSTTLPATPEQVYKAWLSGKEHGAFTGGGKATASTKVGGKFTSWDGYISGKNLELEPPSRIVQSWRSTEFPEGHPDSKLEVLLDPHKDGCKITFIHTDIPEGQSQSYKDGWVEFYFDPMKEYFSKKK